MLVNGKIGEYDTAVYHNPTDAGKCMNGSGECSHNYKLSVIKAYVRRALKVCSSQQNLNKELKYLRQMLVNNGYSNKDFDRITSSMVLEHTSEKTESVTDDVKVFYCNTFTNSV